MASSSLSQSLAKLCAATAAQLVLVRTLPAPLPPGRAGVRTPRRQQATAPALRVDRGRHAVHIVLHVLSIGCLRHICIVQYNVRYFNMLQPVTPLGGSQAIGGRLRLIKRSFNASRNSSCTLVSSASAISRNCWDTAVKVTGNGFLALPARRLQRRRALLSICIRRRKHGMRSERSGGSG